MLNFRLLHGALLPRHEAFEGCISNKIQLEATEVFGRFKKKKKVAIRMKNNALMTRLVSALYGRRCQILSGTLIVSNMASNVGRSHRFLRRLLLFPPCFFLGYI